MGILGTPKFFNISCASGPDILIIAIADCPTGVASANMVSAMLKYFPSLSRFYDTTYCHYGSLTFAKLNGNREMKFLKTDIGYFAPVTSNLGLKELKWQRRPFLDDSFVLDFDEKVSRETLYQLRHYLSGSLKHFSIPFDFSDWTTQMTRWFFTLYQVPYGKTITYQDLACNWGNRRASRAAGQACRRNPIPIIIPCHRITNINEKNKHYSGRNSDKPSLKENTDIKQWLINLER